MRTVALSLWIILGLSMKIAGPAPACAHTGPGQLLSAGLVVPLFHVLREKGNAALYNLDYKTARHCFDQMIKLAPDHPAGYVYVASTVWVETLNARRRLLSSVYSSTPFYVQGTVQDKFDLARDREFKGQIKKAKEAAEARLKKNPRDTESLYYKGAALGLRAAYAFSIRRSWGSAIGDAKESVKIQKKVLESLDPNYTDAKLSVGLYEYTVGSLPFFWRLLARLLGVSGSKEKGINYLQTVAERGKYAQDDARVLLVVIYIRENQPGKAFELISQLASKYPRNHLLGLERAAMLYRLGRHDEGERTFDDLLKDSHIAAVAKDVVNYQFGEVLMWTGKYGEAAMLYKAVTDWPTSEPDLVTLAHLRRGQALDALGRRVEARSEYQLVLKRDDVYNSHNLAQKCNKKPCIPSGKGME